MGNCQPNLPKSTIIMQHTNELIECAIPSHLISNGNRVLKDYVLEGNTCRWLIKVRGKTILLEELGLEGESNNVNSVSAIFSSL